MKALAVYLNGEKLCTAGVGDLGVVSAIVSWVRREDQHTASKQPDCTEEELRLEVGGLISSPREIVKWQKRDLSVGDEILIKIVEAESADKPLKSDGNAEDRVRRVIA